MPNSLSTRAMNTPQGTAGQFAPARRPQQVVPLSVFFLELDGEEAGDDPNAMYGKAKRRKGKKPPPKPKQKKDASGREPQGSGAVKGGDSDSMEKGEKGGQSSASPQESATMSGGTPLIAPGGATRGPSRPGAPSKLGATRATTGATSSGNVAQYPVPIGEPLRRVAPAVAGGKKKKKKRKRKRRKTREECVEWADRLVGLI